MREDTGGFAYAQGVARFTQYVRSGERWYFGDDGMRVQHYGDGTVDIYDAQARHVTHLNAWAATGEVPPLETSTDDPPWHEAPKR